MTTKIGITSNTIEAFANGVFGEFLQGMGSDNQPFLITSPVNIYSKATFTFDPILTCIKIEDPQKYKSQVLANRIYEKYQLSMGGTITIRTGFPVGKGLGSSSADLVATAQVLNAAYSIGLSAEDIEDMIRGIEPTDGVMYPGIVSYYYKQIRLKRLLGIIRGAMVLGVDEGGEIDTVEYNQISRVYNNQLKQEYDALHEMAERAISENNISLMGKIASRSSILNQQFSFKKNLNEFLKIAEHLNLPGVMVAHSGTYIGFLLNTLVPHFKEQLRELKYTLSSKGHSYSSFFMY